MAEAAVVTLWKNLVEDVNTQGRWSQQLSAERKYKAKAELENVNTVKVMVVLAAWRKAPDNRADWSHEFDFDIAILIRPDVKAGDQPIDEYDKWLKVVEEMSDWYEDNRPTIADCQLIGVAFGAGGDQPYFQEHIEPLNQFTSIIRLTFQKLR